MRLTTNRLIVRQFIKSLGKPFALLSALLILLMTLFALRYYYHNIMPFKTRSELLLSQADAAHRTLPETMSALLEAEFYCPSSSALSDDLYASANIPHCGDSKSAYTARLLIQNSRLTASQPQIKGQLPQSIHHMLVTYFIQMSLSPEEQNTLISELSYFGADIQGLSNLSKVYFHKPLANLNLEEAAILTAFIHSPRLINNPQALERRQRILLKRYEMMKH